MDSLKRYQTHLCRCPSVGLTLDVSRMRFDDGFLKAMQDAMQRAFAAMDELEKGAISNPDEQRMVGHYWLRNAELAPDDALREQITGTVQEVRQFADAVHSGRIKPPGAKKFTDAVIVGIGGSALGPQFVSDALANVRRRDRMTLHFLDNTDPDGMERVVRQLGARLKGTLVVVISKSGGTAETRNGMMVMQQALAERDLPFPNHAVAVTSEGSKLDKLAQGEHWIARFPMWDWVGGRTSVTSAVGLLPMALQGLDTEAFLRGAADMDAITRRHEVAKNPAALLALMWCHAASGSGGIFGGGATSGGAATSGGGDPAAASQRRAWGGASDGSSGGGCGGCPKDMVVLPYKDRLILFSRYLQQLVMESLGKENDRDGNVVHAGIAVYGNKGSTDQHAYVQQLRDGVDNFFVTFIVVLQDAVARAKLDIEVEPGVTSGDYLSGFWQGTRAALTERGRESILLMLDRLDAHRLCALVALFERAVGLYAELININAYHQPGVEAGKKAAAAVLEVQQKVIAHLRDRAEPASPEQVAEALGADDTEAETIVHVLEHLAANRRVKRRGRRFGIDV